MDSEEPQTQHMMYAGALSASLASIKNQPLPSLLVPPLSAHLASEHRKNDQQRRSKNKKQRKRLQDAQRNVHRSSNHTKDKNNNRNHRTTTTTTTTITTSTSNKRGVQSAAKLAQRRTKMLQEEANLSNAVNERILVLSKVLPIEFLQGNALTRSFLQENGINVLNRIADRLLHSLKRDVWKMWSIQTIEKRKEELTTRLALFAQQGGMRKLKRMFAHAMRGRTLRMWNAWTTSTVVLRRIEQTPCAIVLQSYGRMFLVRNWLHCATASCIALQNMWRHHASRKITRAFVEHRLRVKTALKIQMRWRARCAWREVQEMRMQALKRQISSMNNAMNNTATSNFAAVSRMNRRSSLGSASGVGGTEQQRRQQQQQQQMAAFTNSFTDDLEREAEELMALAMTGNISMAEVKQRLQDIDQRMNAYKQQSFNAAVTIQKVYIHYRGRCQMIIKARHIRCTTLIQAGYRGYCGRRYASATLAIRRAVTEATRHSASFAITTKWRTYRVRTMQQEALRCIVEAVHEAQRSVACITIQNTFREVQLKQLLKEMEKDMIYAFEYSATNIQRVVRGHQHRVYCQSYRLCHVSASMIQRMFFCYRARRLGKKIVQSADVLTRWSRQTLYRIQLGTLRRRVLHRWARRRHMILRRIMSSWPGWASVGARRDRIINMNRAVRHHQKTMKSKHLLEMIKFIVIQKNTQLLYKKALKWWSKSQLSKGFRTYKSNVHDLIDTRNKVLNAIAWWNKKQMIRGWMQWKYYHGWKKIRALQYFHANQRYMTLLKKRALREFVRAVHAKRMQLIKAAQWFFATQLRQSWMQWKLYLQHRLTYHMNMHKAIQHAQEARPWYRETKGVKEWVRWLQDVKETKIRFQKAIGLWQGRRQGAAFRSWQLLVQLERANRLAEEYWNTKNRTAAVIVWNKWTKEKIVWRKKLVVLNKRAAKYWKGRKAAPPFLKWKAQWQKANADRLEREHIGRLLLQRVGRGMIGRKRAQTKRRINELMRPLRIEREEDVVYVTAEQVQAMRKSPEHPWLAVMYYSDFIQDGESLAATNYKLMTLAFAGAAIDMKNNWPVVHSIKVNALCSYEQEPATNVYGDAWGRGDSLMFGPSERLSKDLPVLRLWWQGEIDCFFFLHSML